MKKQAVCIGFLALTLAPATVRADAATQWKERVELGGTIGLDLANHAGPGANSESFASSYKPSFTIGGTVGLQLSKHISLHVDIAFASKGSHSTSASMAGGTYQMDYMELPILARVSLPTSGRLDYYVLSGPTLGALLDADLELDDGTHFDLDSSFKTFDVGWMLGAGVAVEVGSRGDITFDIRYNHGLRNIDKAAAPEDDEVMNRAFYFTLGYRTNLDTLLGGSSDATATPREPASRPASISPASPSKP